MRLFGSSDPASAAGALTGQPGALSPVRIDATREMLSAFVRALGCVAIWMRMAESGAARLEPVFDVSAAAVSGFAAASAGVAVAAESRDVSSVAVLRLPGAESRWPATGFSC